MPQRGFMRATSTFRDLVPADAPRADWLAARLRFITGTNAPDICGVGYGTALGVFAEKKGLVSPIKATEEMEWGLLVQPLILHRYMERTGNRLAESIPQLVGSNETEWAAYSPDGITAGESRRLVEAKHRSSWRGFGEDGSDAIPDDINIQIHHGLYVTGIGVWDAPIVVNGKLRVFTGERSDALIASMLKLERDFHALLLANVMPGPDFGHETTPGLLKEIYAGAEGMIDLDADTAAAALEYLDARAAKSALEKLMAALQGRLLAAIGNAAHAFCPGGAGEITRRIQRESHVKAHVRKGGPRLYFKNFPTGGDDDE